MIVVTGATGNVGGALMRQLHHGGVGVRAVTRDPRRAFAPPGVEVVEADLARPASLRPAFDGASGLLLLTVTDADMAAILAAARRAGVQRVALVTSLLAQTHPGSFIGRSALAAEQAARDSGLACTVLRPWELASNVLAWAPAIRAAGVVSLPMSGLPSPAVHPADIAALAARALTEDGHAGQTYPLTGPQLLTPAEKVATIGEVLGRALRFEERHDPQALEHMAMQAPDETAKAVMIPGVCALASPGVLTTIETVTGLPARSFRQWVHDHVDAF